MKNLMKLDRLWLSQYQKESYVDQKLPAAKVVFRAPQHSAALQYTQLVQHLFCKEYPNNKRNTRDQLMFTANVIVNGIPIKSYTCNTQSMVYIMWNYRRTRVPCGSQQGQQPGRGPGSGNRGPSRALGLEQKIVRAQHKHENEILAKSGIFTLFHLQIQWFHFG